MPIHPILFPPLPNDAIASYDWQDIASGNGYINFYPVETEGGKMLTKTTSVFATSGKLYSNVATGIDEDFDVTFTIPTTINGKVLITLPMLFSKGDTTDAITPSSTITVYIRHWDGTTETDLGTDNVAASIVIGGAAYGSKQGMYSFALDITKKHFAAGDTLRYTLTGTSVAGGTGAAIWIYRDPADRTATYSYGVGGDLDTTKTTIAIPVDIDK